MYAQSPDAEIFLLGRGGEGKVYRFVDKDGSSVVVKDFIFSSDEDIRSNIASLNFLKQNLGPGTFAIPTVKRGRVRGSFEFPDIRGRALEDMLEDDAISDSLKAHLFDAYREGVKTLFRDLSKKFKVTGVLHNDGQSDISLTLEELEGMSFNPNTTLELTIEENGKVRDIWLGSDQVLVDSETGIFHLIDTQ